MADIVVGVDGSESAALALEWAVAEGDLRDLPVTAVIAWGLLDQHHMTGELRIDPDFGEEEALERLGEVVAAAVGAERAETVGRRAICERPVPALLEASTEAELLVVGARGMGGFKGLLLGSVSQHVLHHVKVPTAIVRTPHEGTESGRVVVGVDGSDSSDRALVWAIEEARLRSAALEAVNAWQPPVLGGYPEAGLLLDPETMESTAKEIVTDALGGVDTSGLATPPDVVVHLGGAAESILEAAAGADVVVLGSRGRGGFKTLLLGSVSMQVSQHSTSTVVVIPPK